MADDTQTDATESTEASKKGMPKKVLVIVAGVMAIEVAAVAAFLMLSGGGASEAVADIELDPENDPDALVEIPIITDRFQNMHTGRVWQWQCEIVIQVKRRDQDRIAAALDRRTAEVTAGIAELIRKATHTQLREPELQSIKRKLNVYLTGVFGEDAEGDSRVRSVLIPMLRGSPADF
ncbi:MAG: hypothetical protein AAF937_00265 [Planctomycetota bacterium]